MRGNQRVTVPEDYMGDVIGDISSRRGRIEGSDMNNGAVAVRGMVPLSEMFGYATDLRSKNCFQLGQMSAVASRNLSAI